MNKSGFINFTVITICIIFLSISLTDCKKTENPIKFPKGTFPDTVISITDINSQYDDYNMALYQIVDYIPVIFSSNRKSSGGQFDLEQGGISILFDQTTGVFGFGSKITTDAFPEKLISKAKTPGNDFGPYTLFSTVDGFEYFLLSSVNTDGNLDFYYLKNQPSSGTILSDITGPLPIKLLNTSFDDAYITLDHNQDTAYFSSNKDGDFDIFLLKKPDGKDLSWWFSQEYTAPVKAENLNSTGNDKCPNISKTIMVFTSDRPGGMGGFDLYYSIYKDGKWNSPVNMGPHINTSSNEYRPVVGFHQDFTNKYIIFSSDRPGGKGGYDLYFTGYDFPDK
jgi:hypothetical protein